MKIIIIIYISLFAVCSIVTKAMKVELDIWYKVFQPPFF